MAAATCRTCSANVRTPLNSPLVGAKEYLSSGIASAAETNSRSTMLRAELTASPGVLAGGGPAICPHAMEQPSATSTANSGFIIRIVPLLELSPLDHLRALCATFAGNSFERLKPRDC